MRIVSTTFWLPKRGNTNEEYEDSAAPMEAVETETDVYRCAVADGATETSFSGFWAKLLCDGFVANIDRAQLKSEWADSVATKELAWYAEQKAESGAYAALVGLTIKKAENGDGGIWEAEAIGDCCLFLARDGALIDSFPMSQSDQFNSNPFLLASNFDEEKIGEMFVTKCGAWQNGDSFFLLSDAIACWTFKREEEHGDSINWLAGIKEQEQLAEFCEIQRTLLDSENRPLMRNDDVTLMRIDVTG
jgi:hypothetical protein